MDREQQSVDRSPDPAAAAATRWSKARRAKWFREGPLRLLRKASGTGEHCMYCDAGEGCDVEHHRPKAVFPEKSFNWPNLLWICTKCNRQKGDRFPPDTGPGAEPLNPMEDNVWRHLRLNKFLQFTGVFDSGTGGLDPRGETTLKLIDLNREALVDRRQRRFRELRRLAEDLVDRLESGTTTTQAATEETQEWLDGLQPDVAQYFLRGPGRAEEPFRSLTARMSR
jgi:hypothetical protein